jgi:hypothetical protein
MDVSPRDHAAAARNLLEAVGRRGQRELVRHLLGVLVLVATVGVVVAIPQVRALLEPPHLLRRPWPAIAWAVLLVGYGALALAVVPYEQPAATPDDAGLGRRMLDTWRRVRWGVERLARRAFDWRFLRTPGLGPQATVVATGVIAAGVVLVSPVSRRLPLETVGIHLLLVGVWLLPLVQRFVVAPVLATSPRGADVARDKVGRQIGRSAVIVVAAALAGEILWFAVGSGAGGLAYRTYSTYAVLQVAFYVLVAARVLDTVARVTGEWTRGVAALGGFVVLLVSPSGERVGAAAPSDVEARAFLRALSTRIDATAPGPVVFVAASGGGSRAALFAALVYENLAEMRLEAVGVPAAPLHERVVLVSSVSGGSLASAYFAERMARGGGEDRRRESPRNLDPDAVNATFAPASRSGAEVGEVRVAAAVAALADGRATPVVDRFLHSAFVDDMATDFMAPLLRGVLSVGVERGASVAGFWEDHFTWRANEGASTSAGLAPLVLFNATTVRDGRRVVVTDPPLEANALEPHALVLGDLAAGRRLSVSDAVRVSANFPWGFDLAEVDVAAREGDMDGQLTDGGVVDNTGLDTLAALVEYLRDAAATGNAEAQRVRDGLVTRGVILLEVDAGARPEPPSGFSSSFASVTRPLHALAQAAHANATVLRARNLLRLRDALRSPSGVSAVWPVRAGFPCNPEGDVPTAWALGAEDLAEVLGEFIARQPRLDDRVGTAFAALAARERSPQANDVLDAWWRAVSQVDDQEHRCQGEVDATLTKAEASAARRARECLAGGCSAAPPSQAWVLAGTWDEGAARWTEVNLEISVAPESLRSGARLRVLHRLLLRERPPNDAGELGADLALLDADAELEMTGAPLRRGAYVWLPVRRL